ncbi:hypothetical protein MTO96_013517 [Rhipicephalus appendiculatus]
MELVLGVLKKQLYVISTNKKTVIHSLKHSNHSETTTKMKLQIKTESHQTPSARNLCVMTAAHNTQQKQKPEQCCIQRSHIEGGKKIGCSGYLYVSFMHWVFPCQSSPINKNWRARKFYAGQD